METTKRHLPFSGHEEPQEHKRMVVRSDEKIYVAATSQSDYLQKISLKMRTMSQNPTPDSMQANNCLNSTDSASLDSTDRTPNANGGDWQEEVYQKLRAMKELYLHDLNDMHRKLLGKLQQYDSIPQQPTNEHIEKLKLFKNMLERFMAFLQLPKQSILATYKDKLGIYERQIVNVVNSNRRKPGAPQQLGQALLPQHMQSQQSHDNQMSSQMQTGNMQGSMGGMQQNNMGRMQQHLVSSLQGSSNPQQNMIDSLQQVSGGSLQQHVVSGAQQVNINSMASHSGMGTLQPKSNMLQHQHIKQQEQLLQSQQLKQIQQLVSIINSNRRKPEAPQQPSFDSTDQTRNANGGDWQEEAYQKIKAMKDLYLHDLNDMHQKIIGKLQQHESLPEQPKNKHIEKLKVLKNLLERFMAFLQIPKESILASYKDKLGTYERQIVNIINSNRRNPEAPWQQGQALPPQHMQSQQSHDNQMSSQMQTGNMQGSVGGMQQNNMGSMQQSSVSSLRGSLSPQQNMMNFMQPSSDLGQVQNSSMNTLQQVSGGSPQQNVVSRAQQVNINSMTSHSGMGMLQPNSNRRKPGAPQQPSLDSTDQTRNANGGDWQEEAYQKIKAMKDLYLHDLNDMHQKIIGKLQQHDSLPEQPKNEHIEKLKIFKNMLERYMAFLQIPKESILASYKDKLGTYERQIVNIINSNRRNPEAPWQR